MSLCSRLLGPGYPSSDKHNFPWFVYGRDVSFKAWWRHQECSGSFAVQSLVKARLHRRFLSRQLDANFVALKLHQVSNMFETPAISRRQITLKIAPGLHVRFWSCNFSATKIASSCRDKNRLCKRALRLSCFLYTFCNILILSSSGKAIVLPKRPTTVSFHEQLKHRYNFVKKLNLHCVVLSIKSWA